jgi:hypothetical protein
MFHGTTSIRTIPGESATATKQAQYLELVGRYRDQANRVSDMNIAAGYKNLANVYETLAESLSKSHDFELSAHGCV